MILFYARLTIFINLCEKAKVTYNLGRVKYKLVHKFWVIL